MQHEGLLTEYRIVLNIQLIVLAVVPDCQCKIAQTPYSGSAVVTFIVTYTSSHDSLHHTLQSSESSCSVWRSQCCLCKLLYVCRSQSSVR
jgi:hypothetical protein